MPPVRSSLVAFAALMLSATSATPATRPIAVTATQAKAMGITLATARPASGAPIAAVPATVTPPLNDRRVVAAPFAGAALRVHVLEGQAVKAGAPLVTLFSRDALAVSSELAQSQAELRVADAAARRTRQLAKEGVIAGARAEEAEARSAQARAMVNERRRLLAGAGGQAGEYVLRAPIAGRVAALNVQPGGGLDAMASAVVIDRTDKLWVEARISPAVGQRMKVGYPVRVGNTNGRVVAVGASIDPRTRSLPLRAELEGGAGVVPGQTVSVTLMNPAPAGAQVIPRAALVQDAAGARVFVRTSAGYQAMPVKVIGAAGLDAVVTGLPVAAKVAANGAAQLKSAAGQ
ncbi:MULTISPECIES: efflux RND transporter periplasmic adaptor subunit [Phenylobacterium]|uniref:Cobalt-zinc-cadmium efflux system membrane fusion protein n=1 Tax=Phenylobacterium koreense TaxID=266125 RepID=A0ABV2EKC6_9CAUL